MCNANVIDQSMRLVKRIPRFEGNLGSGLKTVTEFVCHLSRFSLRACGSPEDFMVRVRVVFPSVFRRPSLNSFAVPTIYVSGSH